MGRARTKAVAARAHDADLVVSGMYGCLHGLLTSFPNHSILKDARRIQQIADRLDRSTPSISRRKFPTGIATGLRTIVSA